MKKMLLTIIMLLFTGMCFSQNILDGIGGLRLGISITDTKTLIGKIKKSDIDILDLYSTFRLSDKVELYKLKKYEPVKGYNISDIDLYFYDGFLFAIKTEKKTNITEAISIKYGDPVIEKENRDTKQYVNGFGVKTEKTDQVYRKKWNTGNENIECSETTYFYHDHHADMDAVFLFEILDKSIQSKIYEELKGKKKVETDSRFDSL